MFGELMRWNPGEELSNWHRDIDDLGRFFQHPSVGSSSILTLRILSATGRLGWKHIARIAIMLSGLIFRVLIPRTFMLRRKEIS